MDSTAELFALADLDVCGGALPPRANSLSRTCAGRPVRLMHPRLPRAAGGPHSSRRRVRQMEDMTELQAKLHRVQAEIAESVGRLADKGGSSLTGSLRGRMKVNFLSCLQLSKTTSLSMFSTATD